MTPGLGAVAGNVFSGRAHPFRTGARSTLVREQEPCARADGFGGDVVQDPTVSIEGDMVATKGVLDRLDGPAVLVGPLVRGGAVITEAGGHDNVAGLLHRGIHAGQE